MMMSLPSAKLIKSRRSSFRERNTRRPRARYDFSRRGDAAYSYILEALKSANIYGILQSRAKNKTLLVKKTTNTAGRKPVPSSSSGYTRGINL